MSERIKGRKMWAYVTLDQKEIYCFTSQKKARGFFAEQGPSKRIKRVRVIIERQTIDAARGKQ